MKNKSGSRTKRVFNSLFKVRSWIDLDRVRAGQRYIAGVCGTYLVPQKNKKTESFNAAKARLKLTDEALLTRQQGLFRLSLIMLGMACLLFGYTLYNLFHGYYFAVLVSTVVMFLALVLAFRYHFWYFQIKHHKLGCTIYEWFSQGLMGAKNE